MKARSTLALAAGLALAAAVLPALPASAQTGTGHANCSTTWSYTWVNSTAAITHTHELAGEWRSTLKSAGVSSFKGYHAPGPVFLSLSTGGNFSGAVYGCTA